MKGLLQKDLYQIWYYARTILLASAIMMAVSVAMSGGHRSFFMVYASFLISMLPMTLLAYDQNSRFADYSVALPVTKGQLVGCKYLIGLFTMVLADLLAGLALAVVWLRGGSVSGEMMFGTLMQVSVMPLLGSAVLLPLTYRFGYEKAKYIYYLFVGLSAALMGFGVATDGDLPGLALPAGWAQLGFWLVCLVLYAVSWRLSIAWYGKAEQ